MYYNENTNLFNNTGWELPAFSNPVPFKLSEQQVEFIKEGKLVKALQSGLDLRVYNAFRKPENLALL